MYYVKSEQKRLGHEFSPESYVYFLPEAAGPCRFGVYNTYQRMVLNSLSGLDKLAIGSLSTEDGYSLAGMLAKEELSDFRKAGYLSVLVTDILDRLLRRIRPYEKTAGTADDFIDTALESMVSLFEKHGAAQEFNSISEGLDTVIKEGLTLIDTPMPRKPFIGIVGEIYIRMHAKANQDLIGRLEHHSAEAVIASFTEWIIISVMRG